MDNLPPFLQKLWDIVNDEKYSEIISWIKRGECFEIFDHSKFSSHILPIFFKTKVFSSFTRQLNLYGFRKLKRDSFIYAHLNFKSEHPEKLSEISRKRNRINKFECNNDNYKSIKIKQELEDIKKWKRYFSKNLSEIHDRQNEISFKIEKIEKKQNEINTELNELKGDIFEKFADIFDPKTS